eukprot:13550724-Alexandrium_andersonii.AAC.1
MHAGASRAPLASTSCTATSRSTSPRGWRCATSTPRTASSGPCSTAGAPSRATSPTGSRSSQFS